MPLVWRLAAAVFACAAVFGLTLGTMKPATTYQAATPPKELVQSFENLAFIKRMPQDAVTTYLAADFVDHDPLSGGTRADYLNRLIALAASGSESREIKRLIAEGPFVVVHLRQLRPSGQRPLAVVDIYRVASGRIAEHWSISEPVTEGGQNRLGAF